MQPLDGPSQRQRLQGARFDVLNFCEWQEGSAVQPAAWVPAPPPTVWLYDWDVLVSSPAN